jgi:ADP-L-glycero-D-manno-heptose 6-epimerase
MKILVTGSKGFIGKNFVNELNKQNINYVEYDLLDGYKNPNDLDFTDVTNCVHLGANSSTTETDIKKVLDNNLTWSIMLFEECVKRNINFQWSSSASVYGKRTKEQGVFRVGDTCYPANIYAQSKFLLETYVMNRIVPISKQGFRYFNVYGPFEEHKGNQASPYFQFEKQAKETGVIRVFEGSENYLRDFVSVDQVISSHLYFIDKKSSFIYNVGTGKPKSFLQVAEEIAEKYNAKIETVPFPESLKKHYQTYTCAETDDENSNHR